MFLFIRFAFVLGIFSTLITVVLPPHAPTNDSDKTVAKDPSEAMTAGHG